MIIMCRYDINVRLVWIISTLKVTKRRHVSALDHATEFKQNLS